MRHLKHAWIIVLFLAACAAVPTPQSIGQSIYLAQSTEIGLVQGLDNAVLAGTVTKSQATQAQAMIASIDAALTTARTANLAGNTATAQSQLQMANQAILALQQYLAAQGVKTK